ncbi:PREDICTED: zinc finger CCCH domain-containing protein 30-like isoform X1 [Ipomoea nil]|uniref:zinc finger CCCH domain-containing protein 30-like isoform X1 n=1 Tax=Ipomoea nil TaxID=35883 RepID=UPI000900BF7D|nr:PREDICTED: zinc finger CCCH domain-containing protein 30-like isoform X1 [Ipomoea nil]XP_019158895.1 PREDICTED: zinc finger CCCH domain-containing protein 30-like isoform X1 [Ipomoea nil]
MSGGPEQSKYNLSTDWSNSDNMKDMSKLSVETDDSFSSLLELAANNDLDGFKRCVERDGSAVDEVGIWLVRKKGAKQIVKEERSPLMVAAMYGSIDVLKFLISLPEVDVNRACGPDKCTALHCATSGGSVHAAQVVKLLLSAGADPNIEDANGQQPADVIVVPPKFPGARASLEELLLNNISDGSVGECNLRVHVTTSNGSSPDLSLSPCSPSESASYPLTSKFGDVPANSVQEKKEYSIDPSLPDIKNSIYSTDEFRMFSFKVRPCSRAYSHDWTECPFVHPGENARRRDPRKYHYSCVPCPDFRKGACRRGDMCEYAHGVFECWLHPAQYRTRLCKEGTSCVRRVCFFAHMPEELRPLYVSTGSAVPSPRSTAATATVMDMAAALSLLPGSPSSHSMMSPAFNQPMSPTANGMSHSSPAWPQPNIPTLHLPGSNLQSSRLRSSLSVRDIPREDLNMLRDFDAQQQLVLNDMACFSQPRTGSASFSRPGSGCTNTLTPSNLDELFSAEIASSSPRYSDQAAFSPSHKSTILSQLQQQQQSMLSPINTNMFSPKNASFGVSSTGRMSPRSVEPISPMSARLSVFAQREKQHQQLRSLSSRDLGSNNHNTSIVGSPVSNSWSNWGSPSTRPDWSFNGDEPSHLRRSSSFERLNNNNNSEEPDLSWVQSLVKESPPEMKDKSAAPAPRGAVPSGEGLKFSTQTDSIDQSVIGTWLEQMQLDQPVV